MKRDERFYCRVAAWSTKKRYFLTLSLCCIVVGGWWIAVYRPLAQRMLSTCEKKQLLKQQILQTQRYTELLKTLPAISSTEWVRLMSRWATTSDIEIKSLKTNNKKNSSHHCPSNSITCSLKGEFTRIIAFFEGLFGTCPLLRCKDCTFAQGPDNLLIGECTLSCYFPENASGEKLSCSSCNSHVEQNIFTLACPFSIPDIKKESGICILGQGCMHDENEHITIVQDGSTIRIIKSKKPFNLGKLKG